MPHKDYYLPERRLVSQDEAALIESPRIPRARFVGSKTRKMTFDAGKLVPFFVDEVLPGDHMKYSVTAYVRMSTPLFPIFDNQRIDTFFFYVPCRLVWENWVKMMGEQESPTDTIAYTVPILETPAVPGDFIPGSIFDYFGLPVEPQLASVETLGINALPLRCYKLIYDKWFRDQNIQNGDGQRTDNGPDPTAEYFLKDRAKSHDYFTSALPWPQKFTAPSVPVAGLAPVIGLGVSSYTAAATQAGIRETSRDLTYDLYRSTNAVNMHMQMSGTTVDARPAVYADLSQATGVAINVFRQAFLVQQLLERDARGGTRYVEKIRSHFGVTSPDFRLQRPEYIGGGQTPLQITPIAQTAPSAGITVGALGAAGTGAGQHSASYAATEHGYIIGLINVRTELSYQQGIHKLWSRSTANDFYIPSLAQLGEQAILRKELYCTGQDVADEVVFGYQERWHEYRTMYSDVAGKFRSGITGTLDAWHLAQNFTVPPTLSNAFIVDDPPMARVLAAGALAVNQEYYADLYIQRTAVRPIPMFGTPATLGRF